MKVRWDRVLAVWIVGWALVQAWQFELEPPPPAQCSVPLSSAPAAEEREPEPDSEGLSQELDPCCSDTRGLAIVQRGSAWLDRAQVAPRYWAMCLSELDDVLERFKDATVHRAEVHSHGALQLTVSMLDYDLQRIASFRRAIRASRIGLGHDFHATRATRIETSYCGGESAVVALTLTPRRPLEREVQASALVLVPPNPDQLDHGWQPDGSFPGLD